MSDPELAFHILAVLDDDPQYGRDIPFEIAKRRDGPVPRASDVDALLRTLDDGAFTNSTIRFGKRLYEIAPRGSAYLAWFAERIGA
ncbi:hypothetical protein WPS_04670 [Vulcanimicrobium alpinum]|uniref:Uncharacterized protein n=1 Tax=Vulcanimicrobium alpinum TaxID=3016050 RepID=A0AAN1XT04_UNVUL|nr:hypothetical protein [Vulcanimicrobium alpinum]BDE05191.1 hypothetical protein WPS_04670 [Vulcanimicrobium alpinum]